MSRAIGIVAALPGELQPLVRRWEPLVGAGGVRGWRRGNSVAACGGMGEGAVTRAWAAMRGWCAPEVVLSVGWAGALTEELGVGAVCRPACVVDARTGERFGAVGAEMVLVTLDRVADAAEKRRLRETYRGAVAVDMEAATVARLCVAAGVEFRCVKAISDGVDAALPDLNPFVTRAGQFRMAGFVGYAAVRPRYWGALVRFGRHASLAAENLAGAVQREIGEMSE